MRRATSLAPRAAAARPGAGQTMAVRSMATYRNHDGMNALSLIDRKKPTPSVPPSEKVFLGSNLITKWMTGVKYYGLQKTIEQAYTVRLLAPPKFDDETRTTNERLRRQPRHPSPPSHSP